MTIHYRMHTKSSTELHATDHAITNLDEESEKAVKRCKKLTNERRSESLLYAIRITSLRFRVQAIYHAQGSDGPRLGLPSRDGDAWLQI
jgi:hypothetical protein